MLRAVARPLAASAISASATYGSSQAVHRGAIHFLLRTAVTISSSQQSSNSLPLSILAQRWASTTTTKTKTAKKAAPVKKATAKKPATKKAAAKKTTKTATKSKAKKSVKAKAKAKPKKRKTAAKKKVAPKKPKRPVGYNHQNTNALSFFLKTRSAELKEDARFTGLNGIQHAQAVAQVIRDEYKALSPERKQTLRTASLRERLRRGGDPGQYLVAIVPDLQKYQNRSTYTLFYTQYFKDNTFTGSSVVAENRAAISSYAKEAGAAWKKLSASEKKVYEDQAASNKQAYTKAVDEWISGLSKTEQKTLFDDLVAAGRKANPLTKALKSKLPA